MNLLSHAVLGRFLRFFEAYPRKSVVFIGFIIEKVCLRNDDAEGGDALLFILMKSKAASAYSHDLAG